VITLPRERSPKQLGTDHAYSLSLRLVSQLDHSPQDVCDASSYSAAIPRRHPKRDLGLIKRQRRRLRDRPNRPIVRPDFYRHLPGLTLSNATVVSPFGVDRDLVEAMEDAVVARRRGAPAWLRLLAGSSIHPRSALSLRQPA